MKKWPVKVWPRDPHSSGLAIPAIIQDSIRSRILTYTQTHHTGKFLKIDVFFKGKFCYIDAYREPLMPKKFDEKLFRVTREEHVERLRNTPVHLCRLRHFGDTEGWSLAFTHIATRNIHRALFTMALFMELLKKHLRFRRFICKTKK